MHNRQSGAAHVPMIFFLLLLVMFLGALGFAYVTQSENTKLIQDRNEARADLAAQRKQTLLIEHYIEDLFNVVNKAGKYEGRPNTPYDGATLSFNGLMNPAEIKQVLDKAAADAGVSSSNSLENVLGAMVARVESLKKRVQDIELERDKALADKNQADSKFNATAAEAAASAREFAQTTEQLRSEFESAKSDRDRNIEALRETVRTKSDELAQSREDAQTREKQLKGEISKHQMQNSALVEQNRLRKPPEVADGKVLVAKPGIPTAFINLGRKDMLQPGTVFRVQGVSSDQVKGYAQVTRVEDERAEVRLYDFVDPIGNYANQGDLLYSDIYTPRVTRTIYLMGRFGAPYTKEQLSNLLTRLGNRVVTKMQPGVDTVILGNNPVNEAGDGLAPIEETDEFKLANELRVEFTYLPKIADLLKL